MWVLCRHIVWKWRANCWCTCLQVEVILSFLSLRLSWLLIFLYIERGLLSLWCKAKIKFPHIVEVLNKSTHRLINSRKLNSSRIYQLTNLQTQKLINLETHQLTNSETYQLINSSTHQLRTSNLKMLILILQKRSNFHSVLAKQLVKK